MKQRLKILLITSIISLLIVSSTYLLPYGFSAVHEGWAAKFWLFVSNTGGTAGVPLITIGFCMIISFQYSGWRRKLLSVIISLVLFSAVLGAFAQFNEYSIKERLKIERPNIKYLASEKGFNSEHFYSLDSKSERRQYLQTFIDNNQPGFISFNGEQLHSDVLNHWLHETGYSFPSGHSVNAFLMATLMAYIILFIYNDYRRRLFFLVPFYWAILVALSRVILGVHSPTDISIGAITGSAAGYLLISFRFIDRLVKQK